MGNQSLYVSSLFLALVPLCAACVQDTRSEADDRMAIDALRMDHVAAVNGRDAGRLLAGMTEDVVYLAPDLPPISGREALEAVVRPAYEQIEPAITMTPLEVNVSGDWAVEWGCLGGTIHILETDTEMPNDGKYLLVYRWQATSGWKIARDVYNMGSCGATRPGS